MTDHERLQKLLASFGIEPSTSKYLPDEYLAGIHVVLYEGVTGYPDYFCAPSRPASSSRSRSDSNPLREAGRGCPARR
jgi:hypothetical protein